MSKIVIVDQCNRISLNGIEYIRSKDRDGNIYERRIDKEIYTAFPPFNDWGEMYNEGYGDTIEKAYKDLYNVSFIPNHLTKEN